MGEPSSAQTGLPETRCEAPLSVVADPDIAGVISEVAGPLRDGACPQVAIRAQESADVLADLTRSPSEAADRIDVWIPASSLWLRLADSRASAGGQSFGRTGVSIAHTPVVMAVPTPLYDDTLNDPNVWPVWITLYNFVTDGRIPRMSMPDPAATTEGALTMVAIWEAMVFHASGNSDGAALMTINLRNHLASVDADIDALLDTLASATDPAGAVDQVGVFPATEQRLLAYNQEDPAVPITPMGLHDAITEADYPMAVSATIDDRRSDIADRLRERLLAPATVERLVDVGFRPPRGAKVTPAEAHDTERWPDYPDPVDVPDASGWHTLMQLWSLP